jgi:hypothetical protein
VLIVTHDKCWEHGQSQSASRRRAAGASGRRGGRRGRTAKRKGEAPTIGTAGFHGVEEPVWNFRIGGYQVCDKWLKDRKGRTLSDEDIGHYQKIVMAISETIRSMDEIDEVIERHGGWPDAFSPVTQESVV